MLKERRFFLCFGDPKSGTTFLQRLLNLHPQISCPSEQKLAILRGYLNEVCGAYSKVLTVMDRRTGGQGAPLIGPEASEELFRVAVQTLARNFAGNKPIAGFNDNDVFTALDYYDRLFNRPLMIAIVRNPVDVAISAWRHNRRLAREEPDNASTHLGLLANPDGTLEGYVRQFSPGYRRRLDAFLNYAEGRSNFLTVLFERLVAEKSAEVHRLLSFLGVERSPRTVERIVIGSAPEAMAAVSTRPQFFGVADPDKAALTVSEDVRHRVLEENWPILKRAGYQSLTALMESRF